MKLNNNSLTSLIFLTIGSFKLNLPQILRYLDYGLMFYFIFSSIMGLVGACASLVECLSVLPSGFAGFIYLDTNAVQGTGVSSSSTLPGSSPLIPLVVQVPVAVMK